MREGRGSVDVAVVMRRGRRGARQAADSTAAAAVARWGIGAQGMLYLLVALLALRIAFGDGGPAADQGGALRELAAQPFGRVLVWAIGTGLGALALWRLSEALFGAAEAEGYKAYKRLFSGLRFFFYGVACFSVLSYAVGANRSGSGDARSRDITARALAVPLGQWLVGIGGLILLITGVVCAVQAVRRQHWNLMRTAELPPVARRLVDVLGVGGGLARGVIMMGAGVFVVQAAVTSDAAQTKGLDATLRSFAHTPAGPWLLAVIAVGLALFGLLSLVMTRYRHV